ncbi:Biopolymer transport protein ExbD/TolR [Planctopirus limnophila DSM 3776]|uniref:Biopolymer transport protein ExbD/TolR n=1 Tax=Planctopirus limnophila (strain ATCC 43296 / DSM 3776 / IFAM 1008 / Mu 290) TaxID=521674 RepID=D5SSZ7_PLAL2|nr:biopolymer transporter ExbD [Planctopirus limnophila]ADG68948.1 Biopolymer transport protein ExbD/TolR [Planctopirus limnophila DSM 3776]
MRHRNRFSHGNVELNMAAMLDMAFQLLAFFILTFTPSPIEGQFALKLPPPVAQTQPETLTPASNDAEAMLDLQAIHLTLLANPEGRLNAVLLEDQPLFQGDWTPQQATLLNNQLKEIFQTPDSPFHQIQIISDKTLHYGDMMKVVEVVSRQKLANGKYLREIGFSERNTR